MAAAPGLPPAPAAAPAVPSRSHLPAPSAHRPRPTLDDPREPSGALGTAGTAGFKAQPKQLGETTLRTTVARPTAGARATQRPSPRGRPTPMGPCARTHVRMRSQTRGIPEGRRHRRPRPHRAGRRDTFQRFRGLWSQARSTSVADRRLGVSGTGEGSGGRLGSGGPGRARGGRGEVVGGVALHGGRSPGGTLGERFGPGSALPPSGPLGAAELGLVLLVSRTRSRACAAALGPPHGAAGAAFPPPALGAVRVGRRFVPLSFPRCPRHLPSSPGSAGGGGCGGAGV